MLLLLLLLLKNTFISLISMKLNLYKTKYMWVINECSDRQSYQQCKCLSAKEPCISYHGNTDSK